MKSSQLVNVPSYIEDPNYRYKMPRVVLKIEGKGNGIKTNLVNLHDIAKDLRCPDEYPLKYLGFELGSQTMYKFKNENDVTCIINGAFPEDTIRKFLDKFIEKFIICPKCKYPEMLIKVRKERIMGQCECCGEKSDLDNTHRLAAFITKNPPKSVKSLSAGVGEQAKAQTGEQNQESQTKNNKSKKNTAEDLQLGSEQLESYLSMIRETYQRQAPLGKIQDVELAQYQLTADIKSINIEKGLYDRLCFFMFQCMFDVNFAKQVENNAKILQDLLKKVDPQYPEVEILLNIQYLFQRYEVDLKYVPTILKLFYDNNYLTDEFLIKWGDGGDWCAEEYLQKHFLWNKEKNEDFRKAAQQIIDWLKQEDEDEEEEEDGEQEQQEEHKE